MKDLTDISQPSVVHPKRRPRRVVMRIDWRPTSPHTVLTVGAAFDIIYVDDNNVEVRPPTDNGVCVRYDVVAMGDSQLNSALSVLQNRLETWKDEDEATLSLDKTAQILP